MGKKGILIASFGTTYKDTREKNIDKIAEQVKKAMPDHQVYQAFSSNQVRKILLENDHMQVPDIEQALIQMKEDGMEAATVLSTHVIDGIENNTVKEAADKCASMFSKITVSEPLLSSEEDYRSVAKALWDELKQIVKNDPVVLMGHGTTHLSDSSYKRLEIELRKYSGCRIYMATVEGSIRIDGIITRMKKESESRGRVLVTPFMLVAGDHANHDMAGDSKDSFVSKLRNEGYSPECIVRGIGEYAGIRSIYMNHLKVSL